MSRMIEFRRVLFYVLVGVIFVLLGIFVHSSNEKEIVQIIPQKGSTTLGVVERVIDGDTIVINTGEEVRYIGINTPEIESSECFATEASEINKNLVLGKEVRLEKDVSETDKYGRLLRYVFVVDPSASSGQTLLFVDDYLVKFGYAKVMTVPPDIRYKDEFSESQKYAEENKLGLWSNCP